MLSDCARNKTCYSADEARCLRFIIYSVMYPWSGSMRNRSWQKKHVKPGDYPRAYRLTILF